MNKTTTSHRLKEIMQLHGLRQVDIIKNIQPLCKKYKLKLGSNDLSQYVTGKVEPSPAKISMLAEYLNVNEMWLMGYPIPPNRDFSSYADGFEFETIESIEKIKKDINSLPESIMTNNNKEVLVKMIDTLKENKE